MAEWTARVPPISGSDGGDDLGFGREGVPDIATRRPLCESMTCCIESRLRLFGNPPGVRFSGGSYQSHGAAQFCVQRIDGVRNVSDSTHRAGKREERNKLKNTLRKMAFRNVATLC